MLRSFFLLASKNNSTFVNVFYMKEPTNISANMLFVSSYKIDNGLSE